jgi:hypothetical protein
MGPSGTKAATISSWRGPFSNSQRFWRQADVVALDLSLWMNSISHDAIAGFLKSSALKFWKWFKMSHSRRMEIPLAFALTLLATPAFADAIPELFIKAGVDYSATGAALAECRKQTGNVRAPYHMPVAPIPNPVGLATAAFLGGVQQGMEEAHMRQYFARRCMKSQGFLPVVFEKSEAAVYDFLLTRAEKDAWIKDVYSPGQFEKHLDKARSKQIAPIDLLPPQAFAASGFLIEPESLTASPGPVAAGAAIVTGKVRYRRTAVLQHDFQIRLPGGIMETGQKGKTAYLARVRESADSQTARSAWCFEGRMNGVPFMPPAVTSCVGESLGEYSRELSFEKLEDREVFDKSLAATQVYFPDRLELSEIQEAPTEELPIEWVFLRSKKGRADIEVRVNRAGVPAVIWRQDLALEADNTVTTPLWSKRLVVHVEAGKATATLRDDGDGADWFAKVATAPVTAAPAPATPASATPVSNGQGVAKPTN